MVDIDGKATNGQAITLASGALLSVNADGGLRYDPNGKFDGLTDSQRATDSFTYTIADEHGARGTATATISIQGKNDLPVANADWFFTDEDSAVRFSVLDNDEDPDAGGLGQGETATDTFTYVVDDVVGGRGTGLVTVTVGGVADLLMIDANTVLQLP